MSNELLKHLSTSHRRYESSAIHLPWKNEATEVSTHIGMTARPKEMPNSSTAAKVSKVLSYQNAQCNDITSKSAHGTRACTSEWEESSEKENQLQEVRTSGRIRKQPEKWTLFFYGQQDSECRENLKEEGKQVRNTKSLSIVHQNIRSLCGKCEELEILLATELNNVEVLC